MTSKYKNSGKTVTWTDYDYVLEIHFNASTSRDLSGDGSYKGVGMMVHTGESNMTIDSEILKNYKILGFKYWSTGQVRFSSLLNMNLRYNDGVSYGFLETCLLMTRMT